MKKAHEAGAQNVHRDGGSKSFESKQREKEREREV
jgi:hypothetical protein